VCPRMHALTHLWAGAGKKKKKKTKAPARMDAAFELCAREDATLGAPPLSPTRCSPRVTRLPGRPPHSTLMLHRARGAASGLILSERSALSPGKRLHHQRSSRHAMVPLSSRSAKFGISGPTPRAAVPITLHAPAESGCPSVLPPPQRALSLPPCRRACGGHDHSRAARGCGLLLAVSLKEARSAAVVTLWLSWSISNHTGLAVALPPALPTLLSSLRVRGYVRVQ
jgi:hypothetical protein